MVEFWKFNSIDFIEENIKDNIGFVYLITNLLSGKMYIGKKVFRKGWKNYFGSCKDLSKDIENFGKQNFKRQIISLHKTKNDLNAAEIKEQKNRNVIGALMENGEKLYYNKCLGDYTRYPENPWNKGIPMTKEVKKKISISVKLKGYKPTEEHIEKMRIGAKNYKITQEHIDAIRKANSKPRDEETKMKISKKLKGIKLTEEQKKQRSISMKEYWNRKKLK